jgi:hypothetical protein
MHQSLYSYRRCRCPYRGPNAFRTKWFGRIEDGSRAEESLDAAVRAATGDCVGAVALMLSQGLFAIACYVEEGRRRRPASTPLRIAPDLVARQVEIGCDALLRGRRLRTDAAGGVIMSSQISTSLTDCEPNRARSPTGDMMTIDCVNHSSSRPPRSVRASSTRRGRPIAHSTAGPRSFPVRSG